jgi:hypothetical protein
MHQTVYVIIQRTNEDLRASYTAIGGSYKFFDQFNGVSVLSFDQ